jgi:hypothetical protein
LSAPITIRVGDRLPVLTRTLGNVAGVSSGNFLPTGTTVVLRVFDDEGEARDYTCTITDAATGAVQYAWANGEPVDAARELEAPVEFTYCFVVTMPAPSSAVVTIPLVDRELLLVHPRLRA